MTGDTRKIIWLASYPKSGNTWMRAFLANYLMGGTAQTPISFEQVKQISTSDSAITPINAILGQDQSQVSTAEVYAARQTHLGNLAGADRSSFIKTHSANGEVAGFDAIPPELTKCAIYIVRNPLDVVLSYADHMGRSLEEATAALADPANSVGGGHAQVVQFLGSWSMHVRSWLGAEGFPAQVLRYEDMLDHPERSFAAALKIAGIELDQRRLVDAIEAADFKSLSKLEATSSFEERTEKQERFFRKGTKGQWKTDLPRPLAQRIASDHAQVMRFLKYV